MDTHTSDVTQRAAEYVVQWRERAGLTPVDVARLSGVSRTKVYDIEGGRGAKPETYTRVVRALGRDPEEIQSILRGGTPDSVTEESTPAATLEGIAADVQRVLENQERVGTLFVAFLEQIQSGDIQVVQAPRRPRTRKRSTTP